MDKWRAIAVLGTGVFASSVLLVGCSERSAETLQVSPRTPPKTIPQAPQNANPRARVETAHGRPSRLYGTPLATGSTASESAERFRVEHAAALGVSASELIPREFSQTRTLSAGVPKPLGLMYDRKTGTYKFSLYRYGQAKGGLPVFRSGLLTLVRNDGNHPVVWASSSVHDVSSFSPNPSILGARADLGKSLAAIRSVTDSSGRRLPAAKRIARLSSPAPVLFAGKEGDRVAPRLALEYEVETESPRETWQLVADAATGDVLHAESAIVFENVTGTVTALATSGNQAMDCAQEVPSGFPYAEVTNGDSSTFGDGAGNFELSNSGSAPLDLSSPMSGRYFDVVSATGTTEQLLATITPPGPASFVHNSDNASDSVRAQSNGYLSANQARDFLLRYLPNYPVIANQLKFTVNVNRSDVYCPGNAWYDGSSLNFCLGSTGYANTAFASVVHHEYGHHIVNSGGSGQGAYGEGMGDTVSVLMGGDPGHAYGFYLNNCATPLRSADNDCQYSASSCSSCGSETHDCGNLLSGTFWSIRKALAVSEPETYVDLINALALNSVPLHVGSGIDAGIAVDLLTLDDDDATLDNGTPHYDEICSGFAAHGMSCPAILAGLSIRETGSLAAAGPVGGPFGPESIVYTLENLGPTPTISYSVAKLVAAPWLTIVNPGGQIGLGQQVPVTILVDQAHASALAQGNYEARLQFSNLTDGVGNDTRVARLGVGAATLFRETFSDGLGNFGLDGELGNLWHVGGSCAASMPGHSAPSSLYFGVDSSCNYYAQSVSVGTATSTAISVGDTSALSLRFAYYLHTEHTANFDQATVQVSVDEGPFTVVSSNGSGGSALLDGSGAWQTSDVDLRPLLTGLSSASVRVRFGFDSVDNVLNEFTGFFVDDVELTGFVAECTSNAGCADGAFCNGLEQCLAGICVAGTPVACSDSISCTDDSCDEASQACSHQAKNLACDDSQVCNGLEICDLTLGCKSGRPPDCNDADACTSDTCDPTLGCQHSVVSCDDGNSCTADSCTAIGGCQHSNQNRCSPGAFLETFGRVVIEAEHFSQNTPRANHTWDAARDDTASAGRCMASAPNSGETLNTGYVTGSPQLDFPVKFTNTGTYHVWLRGAGAGSADRTVHVGLDGVGLTTANRIGGFSAALSWSKTTLDGPVATLHVTSAGVHTINLWMRDDGFRVDRLLLTTSHGFVPTGLGPAESTRSQPCTTDSCGDSPCSTFCADPVIFSGGLQSGGLGALATCHQTVGTIHGGNCGNFLSPRTLSVNGTVMPCDNGNWSTLPPKVNGGYCVQTTAGNQPWAYFTTW